MNALLEANGGLRELARATAELYTWQSYAEKLLAMISALAKPPVAAPKP